MTIQEVIKSGKRFRRANFNLWNDAVTSNKDHGVYNMADVLADDWETEKCVTTKTIEIWVNVYASGKMIPHLTQDAANVGRDLKSPYLLPHEQFVSTVRVSGSYEVIE